MIRHICYVYRTELNSDVLMPLCSSFQIPLYCVMLFKISLVAFLAPGPVRDVTVSYIGNITYIHWNLPVGLNGPLTGYEVTYQKLGVGYCPGSDIGGIRVC